MSLKWTRIVDKATGLSRRAQAVLRMLADMADQKGRCFPKQENLGERLGMSRSTAWRAVQELKAEGWLTSERRYRQDGTQTSDLYQVVDKLGDEARRAASRRLPLLAVLEPVNTGDKAPPLRARQSVKLNVYQSVKLTQQEPTTSKAIEPTTYTRPDGKRSLRDPSAQSLPGGSVSILKRQARNG